MIKGFKRVFLTVALVSWASAGWFDLLPARLSSAWAAAWTDSEDLMDASSWLTFAGISSFMGNNCIISTLLTLTNSSSYVSAWPRCDEFGSCLFSTLSFFRPERSNTSDLYLFIAAYVLSFLTERTDWLIVDSLDAPQRLLPNKLREKNSLWTFHRQILD